MKTAILAFACLMFLSINGLGFADLTQSEKPDSIPNKSTEVIIKFGGSLNFHSSISRERNSQGDIYSLSNLNLSIVRKLNSHIGIGGGIGMTFFGNTGALITTQNKIRTPIVPLFATFKYQIADLKLSPYAQLNVGPYLYPNHNYILEPDFILLDPSIGIQYDFGNGTELLTELIYNRYTCSLDPDCDFNRGYGGLNIGVIF